MLIPPNNRTAAERQETPPGRAFRDGAQVIATIAPMSICHTAPITRIAGRIVVIAFNASGLRTCEGVFPHVFPLLNPFNARTNQAGQWGEMPIRKRQNLGLDSPRATSLSVSSCR